MKKPNKKVCRHEYKQLHNTVYSSIYEFYCVKCLQIKYVIKDQIQAKDYL